MKKRVTASDREALVMLYSISSVLEHFEGQLKSICQRVPNGWLDARMIQSKLNNMIIAMLETIPVEQLKTIKHHMDLSTIHVGIRSAGKRPDDYWIMTYTDLADLAEYATKAECMFCEGKSSCRLREVLKELPIQEVSKLVVPCWKE